MPTLRWRTALLWAVVVCTIACVKRMQRQVTSPQSVLTVDRKSPFLKAHMQDGQLFVLSNWSVDSTGSGVTGSGLQYDVNRSVIDSGTYRLGVDSVTLFETNVLRASPSVAALSIVTGLSAGLTAFCIADPKACFGSCPTFYATDGDRELLQAEGFSASIAPSLEARDVDALYRARPKGRTVEIRMVNEAYETHVVRTANLLVAPRERGRRVIVDPQLEFWSTAEPTAATSCKSLQGDCLDLIERFDGREYLTPADSSDLAARETIELRFTPPAEGRTALVIASRQSLLPTYLLYQSFAYLGKSVGEWLAAFERADPATRQRVNGLVETLGGIAIQVHDRDGQWINADVVRETGPLAADVKLIALPSGSDPSRVRLRMARGAWRVDYVALTTLVHRVDPVRLEPRLVFHGDTTATEALRKLRDPNARLVTFPGDSYKLVYNLAGDAVDFELFLESQGYYLEWMRQEWMAEENPLRAAQLFVDPAGALRLLAAQFKRVESELETAFWNSKYAGF